MATATADVLSTLRTPAAGLAGTTKAAEIQDRFLTLLVTQLKHQDPLSPMDNSQITTQLSQISTVSGIDKLNDTMSGLAQAMAASQTMNSVSMIGRQVLTASSSLNLANKSAAGAIELKDAADSVSVTVTGAAGNIVRRMELGAMEAGMHQFSWDGKSDAGAIVNDGSYGYKVEAMKNGKSISASTFSLGTVSGVGLSGSDSTFILNGGKEVKFADVRRVQ